MFPGVNPRQMQKMMQKMGMQQVDLKALKIVITLTDKELVFENPGLSKINMMGQETYQITGSPIEQTLDSMPEISSEDVQTVVDQTGKTEDEARAAIIEAKGDLAEAIMNLSSEE
ncbi:nascent polypeptide-associated complex protein [archaeon]|nr:nascent polypeptide-associated complex protein [archaeon]|tara:strand:- start:897 stop:1241 length:345 start_codon:yes stop_codon:yes gene_type:complete